MYRKSGTIIPIDFNKPWWEVIWSQKWALGLVILGETVVNIFETITPILIGLVFQYQKYYYFIYFAALWFGIILFQDFIRKINTNFELRCIHSIHFNAHKALLETDPIFHAHRDSGAILAKIDRASRSYENLLDAVVLDILGYAAGIITTLLSLMQESFLLAFILLCLLVSIITLNIKLAYVFIIPSEQDLIKADDSVKSVSQENLLQTQLIRSYFASNEINEKLKEKDEDIIYQERKLWNANITIWSSVKILYLSTVFILGSYLLHAINKGDLSVVTGISFMLMYIQGTYGVISVERPMRVAVKSITRIKDLFAFIPNFGKQTFPVLHDPTLDMPKSVKHDTISLHAENISFSYNHAVTIFQEHSLKLTVDKKQPYKLYGIIGPSGVGKSTLLSMLGGQLKPYHGVVKIDGIDIYSIDDIERRSLIAMQCQTAVGLRGSLRYNLLFGLPASQESKYDDDYLKNLLHRVGLWSIFKTKNGLETKVGESGLTLSGGQRQRLNFASLYLRADCYKPSVILIDEPTSSLDEISEQAITDMIEQLARNALTLVIAHRLKTIQNAIGILDFSLIATEKIMVFYPQKELLEKSFYYQQLMHGNISLEE